MGVGVAERAADHAEALADVRWWWRQTHPGPGVWRRLDTIYMVAISVAILGALAYGTASSALAQVVTPDAMARVGPPVALLAVRVTAQWGAYQGPVVFSVPDVAHLLGAPLPRRGLAWRRLVRALAAGALVGAVVGAVVLIGLAGRGRGVTTERAIVLVAGAAELGILGVAAAWAVERSARWERAARLALWPAAALAAALIAAMGAGEPWRTAARWSGPWAWAVQAPAGAPRAQWVAGLVALTAATAAASTAAVYDAGRCSAERHLRRAEARAGAVAALMLFDARSARRAFETTAATATARPARAGRAWARHALGARGARPAARVLATTWRDGVSARRTPARVLEAAFVTACGAALALLNADRPAAVLAGVGLLYAGAARMLWPLRAELDLTSRARVLLRPPIGSVMVAHLPVPAITTAAAAALAATGCAIAGGLGGGGPLAAALAVLAAPTTVVCAAMSARRGGQLPQSVLAGAMAADPSGGGIGVLAWLAWWPAVAAALGAGPLLIATRDGASAGVLAAGAAGAIAVALARSLASGPTEP
jgi:hypothetical protein